MSKHSDVVKVGTGRPVPGPVNPHPGPDLDREADVG